ncbi:hypothetical protein RKD55_004653 [Rossellomorea marisflavi]
MLFEQLDPMPDSVGVLILSICIFVIALAFGIPAILKHSLKGVIFAIFLSAFTGGMAALFLF